MKLAFGFQRNVVGVQAAGLALRHWEGSNVKRNTSVLTEGIMFAKVLFRQK